MNGEGETATDGGTTVVDRDELDAVVRNAVRGAMLDVAGTLFLLVLALLFLGSGMRGVFVSSSGAGIAFSGALLAFGLLLAGMAFDLVPPFRV
ncbi:hypothetical protein [Saliphagus infecundisoli]|uniref:Transporter n=1 Tax=Saliphagus infecundisoli TaxID=1849069 RepID=A0ABD5QBK8_9EURY|nr:hypothetical protein [Saliphagus infecundisoli]